MKPHPPNLTPLQSFKTHKGTGPQGQPMPNTYGLLLTEYTH